MRVVLAEDPALLREGLVGLLEAHGCTVAAAVDNGPSLVRALVEHRPDVAVVDVRLPPSFTDEGLQAAPEARGSKHTANIFAELGLAVSDDDNRHVLAVLAYLNR